MRAPAADEPDAPSPSHAALAQAQHERGTARGVCPYLEVSAAGWRHAVPSRDHRCRAIAPAPPLTTDKQRRLCLGPAHITCASYLGAALARRAWAGGPSAAGDSEHDDGPPASAAVVPRDAPDANRWALSRTSPTVSGITSGTHPLELIRHRAVAQVGLGGLLVVAFVAIMISRGPGDGSSGALLVPTATPSAAPTLAPTPVPSASPTPSPTLAPTPTPEPTPTPGTPTPATTTYRVVSGDTLSGIAGRFGTTVKAIMELNGLTSTTLRIGQQLIIPAKGAATPARSPATSPASSG